MNIDKVRVLSMGALVVGTVVMAGCDNNSDNSDNRENDGKTRVAITQADNGGTVNAFMGDDVEVALPANPTTGYQWGVVATDESRLSSVGSSYTPDSSEVGSGGTYRSQFRAVATGEVHLRLVYSRSSGADVVATFEVTVDIM